ncbi:MAG: aspartate aminotransferase family protein [Gammaproteobacteria bacterium]|nr:aspartate aminotransferase family protein [Gammaproteobacteria bacterium]
MNNLMRAYAPPSLVVSHGKGVWLFDENGEQYLDGFGGIAVNCLGHAHPAIAAAIADQATRINHCSNIFVNQQQIKAAQTLCELANMDRVFFCNSGAEANEAAIKHTRLHATKRGISNPVVITFEHSFHGRTMATLSATGNASVKKGFEPLVGTFVHLPYNDVAALEQAFEKHDNIVGVMVELIQGEGGIRPATQAFANAVRALCTEHDALMICDEIQCGMGRTGHWFSYQHYGVQPDVTTLAKSLGNGFPIGACLSWAEAADLIQPGTHGTTYGGNPMAARVALEVISVIQTEALLASNLQKGDVIMQGLREALGDSIVEVRGRGLMIGIELPTDPSDFVTACKAHKLLVVKAANNTVRLLPAYTISEAEIQDIIERMTKAMHDLKEAA